MKIRKILFLFMVSFTTYSISLEERKKSSLNFGLSKEHFLNQIVSKLNSFGFESNDGENKLVELKSKHLTR